METDVLAAWVKKCRETPSITDALAGGVHHEPISASKNEEALQARVIYPYGALRCEPSASRKREWSTGGHVIDYWDVILSLYHPVKEHLGGALVAVEDVFDALGFDRELVIDHPSIVCVMRVEGHLAASSTEKESRQGEDVHRVEKRWTVWLHRDTN